MSKLFYRVAHEDNQQGLWYDPSGKHTGLIHSKFNFCTNSKLEMPFDPELVGFLSAVPSMDELFKWFTFDDILELQTHGFFITLYEATRWKFYERFQHTVICSKSSKLIHTFKINLRCL